MELKIVAEEKYLPQYANETDACMDLKACLKTSSDAIHVCNGSEMKASITINPGEVKKIGTGVQVAIPEGYVMKMYVRSSTGIKKHLCLANGTGIIDAGYRDEIIMALYNFGDKPIEINDGDRLCQFVVLPYPKLSLKRVKDDENFRNGDRLGGIGSTGEK